MGDADERQQVVLAHRPDREVAGDDEFVVPPVAVEGGETEFARLASLSRGGGPEVEAESAALTA